MFSKALPAALMLIFSCSAYAQNDSFKKIENGHLLAPIPLDNEIDIVDGDTLWLGIHEIRLYGVDAPEHGQPCISENQSPNFCYKAASKALENFSKMDNFRCEIRTKNDKAWKRYGRYIAKCYVGELDIGSALVSQGLAYADPIYGDEYLTLQAAAIKAKIGMHSTEHKSPKAWRKEKNEVSPKPCQ